LILYQSIKMPKTLKILGTTYSVTAKTLPETEKYRLALSSKQIFVNASLDKDDRAAFLLSAVSTILSKKLKDADLLALHWAIFVQDNIFDLNWISPTITSVSKKQFAEGTTTKNVGGDIRLIVRTGL